MTICWTAISVLIWGQVFDDGELLVQDPKIFSNEFLNAMIVKNGQMSVKVDIFTKNGLQWLNFEPIYFFFSFYVEIDQLESKKTVPKVQWWKNPFSTSYSPLLVRNPNMEIFYYPAQNSSIFFSFLFTIFVKFSIDHWQRVKFGLVHERTDNSFNAQPTNWLHRSAMWTQPDVIVCIPKLGIPMPNNYSLYTCIVKAKLKK